MLILIVHSVILPPCYSTQLFLLSVRTTPPVHATSIPPPVQASWSSLIPSSPTGHHLITTDGYKQKPCYYCSIMGRKTSTGNTIWTRVKCSICDVPLCQGSTRTQRKCFKLFHEQFIDIKWNRGPGWLNELGRWI